VFENAVLLREILTWGRENSRQVQDLESKVGCGEQQRSCSPETSLQLRWRVIVEQKFSVQ
jgi:hypothetical protein